MHCAGAFFVSANDTVLDSDAVTSCHECRMLGVDPCGASGEAATCAPAIAFYTAGGSQQLQIAGCTVPAGAITSASAAPTAASPPPPAAMDVLTMRGGVAVAVRFPCAWGATMSSNPWPRPA